ncbi:MAG: S-layer homology domain-containing protein [Oscillospiraceae bacterium]
MKLNHGFRSLLTAVLAATMLMGTTLAAPLIAPPISAPPAPTEALQPVRVYGSVASITAVTGGSRILLENSNEKDPYQKIGVLVTDQTVILDAVTRTAKTMKDIEKGETLYAYVGPAIKLSMPPQADAVIVICNIPADFGVPTYEQLQTVTRGEFMQLLYTSANSPAVAAAAPFTDVDTAAVSWAVEQKIAAGTGATTFNPEGALTREQMMTFLLRYATALEKGPVGAWATRITYADLADIASWAVQGAMWNQITDLVKADGENQIRPRNTVTAAEAATAVQELLAR